MPKNSIINNVKHSKTTFAIMRRILLIAVLSLLLKNNFVLGEEEEDPFEINVAINATNLTYSLNDTTFYRIIAVECQNVNAEANIIKCDELSEGLFICNNLDACSNYLTTLSIQNLTAENELTFQRQRSSDTEFIEPIVENINVEKQNFSLDIYWNATYATCIEQVQIRAISLTSTSSETKNATGSENHAVITNLSPCSKYQLEIHIIDKHKNDKSLYSEEQQTDYVQPTAILNEPITDKETITLTWSTNYSTCVQNYQVNVSIEGENGLSNWNLLSNVNQLIIPGRNPCVLHNIMFRIKDINNVYLPQQNTTAQTDYAEPGNVNISIATVAADIKVSWTEPQYKTCVEFYHIKWFQANCPNNYEGIHYDEAATTEAGSTTEQPELTTEQPAIPENDCSWFAEIKDKNIKEFIIKGLDACDDFKLDFYINNLNEPKSEQQSFATLDQPPGSVKEFQFTANSTELHLNWKPPILNTKCVANYTLILTGPLQSNELEQWPYENITTDIEFFYDHLEPCGDYSLSIKANSYNGSSGETLQQLLSMEEDKPSAVTNAFISAEERAIEISWVPPQVAALCLQGYRIAIWDTSTGFNKSIEVDKSETSTKIDQLSACHTYVVQIIAHSNEFDASPTQLEAETAVELPNAAYSIQKIATYPDGLELNAQDINNTCTTIFARFRCNATRPNEVIYKYAEQYVESGTLTGTSFQALLTPLSPYAVYNCYVALYNGRGWSAEKGILNERTMQYYPDRPESLEITHSTNESLYFKWQKPTYANGEITIYQYHFQTVEAAYTIPARCSQLPVDVQASETGNMQQTFSRLYAFTKYSLQVAAKNGYGVGEFSAPFIARTDPWISEPISALRTLTELKDTASEYAATVVISWLPPCKSNGEIEEYRLTFTGQRANYLNDEFTRSIKPSELILNDNGELSYNNSEILPEYNYEISVSVKTMGVSETSQNINQKFDAPAGIPTKLNEDSVRMTRVDAFMASNPAKSAVVEFPANILESETGSIKYMAFLLSEKECNEEPTLNFGVLNSIVEWPAVKSWHDVYQNDDCIQQYQTNDKRWEPKSLAKNANTRDNEDVIQYVIGIENCENSNKDYCNGPLKAGTEYYLVMRLFTKSGYNDVVTMQFKTDTLIQLKLIIIIVCSCLFLALVIGFIYIWITKRRNWKRDSYHGIEDSLGDVQAKNFAIYYKEVSKPDKIAREFKDLQAVAVDLSFAASELSSHKNRYADIYPYDKNRVILDVDSVGTDYINASFIEGYKRKKEYIATQGPKRESVMDFWRMILQHNVRIIVMVTQFREGDVIKCHEYYPFKDKGINVSIKKKETFELYDRTEMSVTHDIDGLKQKVVHFYFKKWPDHGCPEDPNHLITFVRKVKAEKLPRYSPIVVHCSAGVGRTGTFIGLDIIMQRLRNESKINIFETVKKLRFQRMKMVQTLMQYTFLYSCTYELVKHKAKRAAVKAAKERAGSKKVSFQDEPEIAEQQHHPYKNSERFNMEVLKEDDEIVENGKHFNLNGALSSSHYMPDVIDRNESPM